jgi:hypothetical protein
MHSQDDLFTCHKPCACGATLDWVRNSVEFKEPFGTPLVSPTRSWANVASRKHAVQSPFRTGLKLDRNFQLLWGRRRMLHDAASHRPKSWLAGKQFLNGLHGIEETIGLGGKRYEIVA